MMEPKEECRGERKWKPKIDVENREGQQNPQERADADGWGAWDRQR